jgi:hypothetical protein
LESAGEGYAAALALAATSLELVTCMKQQGAAPERLHEIVSVHPGQAVWAGCDINRDAK